MRHGQVRQGKARHGMGQSFETVILLFWKDILNTNANNIIIMTEEITARIVSLYRYEIRYNEDVKDAIEYDYVIVADSIERLINRIALRELVYSMKDCKKYLSVDEFLTYLAPDHYGRVRVHRVFDIGNHDIASASVMIDDACYDCSFSESGPQSVDVKTFGSVCVKMGEDLKDENADEFYRIIYGSVLGDWLYDSIPVRQAIDKQKKKEDEESLKEKNSAHTALRTISGNDMFC